MICSQTGRSKLSFSIRLAMLLFFSALTTAPAVADEADVKQRRTKAWAEQKAGNFQGAFNLFKENLEDEANAGDEAAGDLDRAVTCLRKLRKDAELDALLQMAARVHADDVIVMTQCAQQILRATHYGKLVGGEFERGYRRGSTGQSVQSNERDRAQALQWLVESMPNVSKVPAAERVKFFRELSRSLLFQRDGGTAWRLQELTDEKTLPDYGQRGFGFYRYGGSSQPGAAVSADGEPVLYSVPESWAAATSDGERWRWALEQIVVASPRSAGLVDFEFAQFLQRQFGVQTMGFSAARSGRNNDGDLDRSNGPWAVHTLKDDETIAKLATGVKRFTLPAGFQYIKILQDIVAGKSRNNAPISEADAARAITLLTPIMGNRRQFPRQAKLLEESIRRFGDRGDIKRKQLDQIRGKWGQFEPLNPQLASAPTEVGFRFRNATKVQCEAFPIDVERLLADTKNYLRSNPDRIDSGQTNISQIGYRLVRANESRYLRPRVAQWDVDLKPAKDHFDSRITINTPLQNAGAYFVVAKIPSGNTSRIVMWVQDTVIARKRMNDGAWYFLADSKSGAPIGNANLEFFGYQQKRIARNKYQVDVKNFAVKTDENGQAIVSQAQLDRQYSWLVMGRSQQRLAFFGYDRIWYSSRKPGEYRDRYKVYAVTDRPVYRPDSTVKYKFWVRNARFDADGSKFANQKMKLTVRDPKNAVFKELDVQTDAWGGIDGDVAIPADATLGRWNMRLETGTKRFYGNASFRIEEYRKPEYEVTIQSPDKPVQLGEKIPVSIQADYFFGAPVTNAKVHYTVKRTKTTSNWYPAGPWDWLYGRGYWWFAVNHEWYPGWSIWGCRCPTPPWWSSGYDPPELVIDTTVDIGPDGRLNFEIDTALAQELHGDSDHRYAITAEVVDESRRTIVGQGSVLVARQPFQTTVWTNRGYYKTGDTISVTVNAHTADHKPVAGEGVLRMLAVRYDANGKPRETEVERWNVALNERGEATERAVARTAGQFRFVCEVTDENRQSIEGGYLVSVRGNDENGNSFRFNDLELIADQPTYEPGGTVKLLLNTNHIDNTVALFLRPANNRYFKPKMLRRAAKSSVVEIPIEANDMPNFFVEAVTVANGKVHTETREIIVPPEKRVANVTVDAVADSHSPGDETELVLKFTDAKGQPFQGSTVVAVYDKSVEAIAGTGPGDIREFFWKFRRTHRPEMRNNIAQQTGNVYKKGEIGMQPLGIFGGLFQTATLSKAEPMSLSTREKSAETAADSAQPMGGGRGRVSRAAGPGATPGPAPPVARSEFADTAFWSGRIEVDAGGTARVKFKLPDNLTTWKIRAWTLGHGTQVGEATTEIIASKKVLVRMQTPRFFVERDQLMLSANVHNYLDAATELDVQLSMDDVTLAAVDAKQLTRRITIPAGGEQRIDWPVKVIAPGQAKIRMQAVSNAASDAIEKSFPVAVHGMLRTESWTGAIRDGQNSSTVEFSVPKDRRPDATRLEIRYSPSVALAMVDALPYLVSAPEKTTDCVLNRFLPTVLVQKVLQDLNLNLADIQAKRTNLNAQEIGDDAARAKDWQRGNKRFQKNPVFDNAQVDELVRKNLQALYEMQLSGGGWGWFSGYGEYPTPHMTSLAVHALTTAKSNDVAIVPDVHARGVAWLKNYQAKQIRLLQTHDRLADMDPDDRPKRRPPSKAFADNTDALVFKTLVEAGENNDTMRRYLFRDRTKLSVYGMTLFALGLQSEAPIGQMLDTVLTNISQYEEVNREADTAWLRAPANGWWYWYRDEVEATAHYLKLIASRDKVLASRLAKYLINNRKHATYWRSPRDTGFAIEALAHYVRTTKETSPDMTVDIAVDGKVVKQTRITADNLFAFDNAVVLSGDALDSGKHSVTVTRRGTGPVYFNAYLTNFSKEDDLQRTGLELKVNRRFFRLIPDKSASNTVAGNRGQVVRQAAEKFRREELANRSEIRSGDLIEVELLIESGNDYEYLMFADRKPAGFEPVDQLSGYISGGVRAYREIRDDRVTFFVQRLSRGTHSLSYRIRAETPGQFAALPAEASAVYAPELKGNSDEWKVRVAQPEE